MCWGSFTRGKRCARNPPGDFHISKRHEPRKIIHYSESDRRIDFDSPLLQSTTLGPFLWVCLSHRLFLWLTLLLFLFWSVSQTVSHSQASSFTQNSLSLHETTCLALSYCLSLPDRLNPLSLRKHDLRASSLLLLTDLPKLSLYSFLSFSVNQKNTQR